MNIEQYRRAFRSLLTEWKQSFPDLAPPDISWWSMWLSKYGPQAIYDAMFHVASLPKRPKATDDIGKVMSAVMRDTHLLNVLREEVRQ